MRDPSQTSKGESRLVHYRGYSCINLKQVRRHITRPVPKSKSIAPVDFPLILSEMIEMIEMIRQLEPQRSFCAPAPMMGAGLEASYSLVANHACILTIESQFNTSSSPSSPALLLLLPKFRWRHVPLAKLL